MVILTKQSMGPSTFINSPFMDLSTESIATTDAATTKSLSKRKRVRFVSTASFVETLHINNYTTEEFRNTWYSRDEYSRISKELKESLALQESGPCSEDTVGNDNFCLRGLEAKTEIGFLRRKRNKRNGMQAVLVEQENQLKDNLYDTKAIAMAYHFMTKHCVTLARELGIADELDAAEIYLESKLKENLTTKR
jgi:hypothetical protein